MLEQILQLVRKLNDAEFDALMNKLDAEDLRRKVQLGVDELDRGERIPAADVYSEIRSKLRNHDP